ncbi:hypothetical protein FQN50_000049 [Emmonsiellopsis sp. PD_5]|nr:hypothetical protein FQN50_000049 [Emmonsiellopsis sp. PD_5]
MGVSEAGREAISFPSTANNEKQPHDVCDPSRENQPANILGETSPGVSRVEAISRYFTLPDRILFFFGIFLIAYVYGLDGTIRGVYQPHAVASYGQHSLLATVGVLRGVIGAAAQPTIAKIADVFGRAEVVFITIIFYVMGMWGKPYVGTGFVDSAYGHQELSLKPLRPMCKGSALIGYTGIILLVEVLIADTTSLRSRLLFSYIPALPFLLLGARQLSVALFWQLDVIGVILLIAVFALILVPFTLAGGIKTQWETAKVIAPLVIGVLCIPAWIYWEKTCKHPMIPFRLLKDRSVWGALGLAVMLNCAWYLQGDFLYTVLIVAFDESVLSASRISFLYSFSSVITGCVAGLIVFKIRRLKAIIVAGTILFVVAFGLLINYRGGTSSSNHSGMIGAQILLGIAGDVAVITGLYLASYNIGSALGNTISGAIWNQVLPGAIISRVGDAVDSATIYADPFAFTSANPVGTPVRDGVIDAYRHTQRLLCITGICLSVLLVCFASVLRDPVLGNEQSLEDAEKESVSSGETQ